MTDADDRPRWQSELLLARARRNVAERAFRAAVGAAAAAGATPGEIADALLVPLRVVEPILDGLGAEGTVVEDPYAVAERYAVGELSREEMRARLVEWTYVPDREMADYWDDAGVTPEGSFSIDRRPGLRRRPDRRGGLRLRRAPAQGRREDDRLHAGGTPLGTVAAPLRRRPAARPAHSLYRTRADARLFEPQGGWPLEPLGARRAVHRAAAGGLAAAVSAGHRRAPGDRARRARPAPASRRAQPGVDGCVRHSQGRVWSVIGNDDFKDRLLLRLLADGSYDRLVPPEVLQALDGRVWPRELASLLPRRGGYAGRTERPRSRSRPIATW